MRGHLETVEISAFGTTISVEVEYTHTPAEKQTDDCPGCDAEISVEAIRLEWRKEWTKASMVDEEDLERVTEALCKELDMP